MKYQEFRDLLKKSNISVKKIASSIGYSTNSIESNWSKFDKVPPRAKLAIEMYLKLQVLENENNQLKDELTNKCYDKENHIKYNLSQNALRIITAKCKEKEISIEEYISSLIIANI